MLELTEVHDVCIVGQIDIEMRGGFVLKELKTRAFRLCTRSAWKASYDAARDAKEIATAFAVSENYFEVLGVAPVRGRTFDAVSPAELAASPAVLISENYWHDRFAGDPDIVGKIVRLNGAAFTIAGVTPANFTGTSIAVPNFWLPLSLYPSVYPDDRRLRERENRCCRIFGRLAPGVTMREAQAEATVLSSHGERAAARWSDVASHRRRSQHARRDSGWK